MREHVKLESCSPDDSQSKEPGKHLALFLTYGENLGILPYRT